jgi:hypothetical protein
MNMYSDDNRIAFGPGDTDTVPPEWAAGMLTWLKTEHPGVFRDALAQALGIEPAPQRRRRTAPADLVPSAPALSVATGQHAKTG